LSGNFVSIITICNHHLPHLAHALVALQLYTLRPTTSYGFHSIWKRKYGILIGKLGWVSRTLNDFLSVLHSVKEIHFKSS
jgi:hypothetical protein